MIGFIIRLVGYAVLLGVVTRVALIWWSLNGLDNVAPLPNQARLQEPSLPPFSPCPSSAPASFSPAPR